MKTTLPNKSGNPENPKKVIIAGGELFNYYAHS